jgi:hypothetical protein
MLSVIVPYCREWPQVAFTLRSIHEALNGVEHEVIAVDNLQSNMVEDRGSKNVEGMANSWSKAGNPWLRYIKFEDKLSHWQAKNLAMSQANGDYFWFIDAHCICPGGSTMLKAYQYYQENESFLNGSLHLPLTYHILEPTQLMYKAVIEPKKFDYAYRFHTLCHKEYKQEVILVPAMSTCGMLVSKEIMWKIGCWPTELGIYSGGEHYLNYVFAIMGLNKWVWNGSSLCHHGDKRGYNWNHYDQQRNRAIACFMYGGEDHLIGWMTHKAKLSGREKQSVMRSIYDTCEEHRQHIAVNAIKTIEEWVEEWRDHELLILGE